MTVNDFTFLNIKSENQKTMNKKTHILSKLLKKTVRFFALQSAVVLVATSIAHGQGHTVGIGTFNKGFDVHYIYDYNDYVSIIAGAGNGVSLSIPGLPTKSETEIKNDEAKEMYDVIKNHSGAILPLYTGLYFINFKASGFSSRIGVQLFPFQESSVYITGIVGYNSSDIESSMPEVYEYKVKDEGLRFGLGIGYNSLKYLKSGFGFSAELGTIMSGHNIDLNLKIFNETIVDGTCKASLSPYLSLKLQYAL